jgi:Kef-type K+ transport system membrane component KefB
MLNVLLVTLGLAYLTELAGLSLALGAFVAGMLIPKRSTGITSKRTSSLSAMC